MCMSMVFASPFLLVLLMLSLVVMTLVLLVILTRLLKSLSLSSLEIPREIGRKLPSFLPLNRCDDILHKIKIAKWCPSLHL